jgi:hypothetical protein
MIITSNGNIGIGTSSPSTKLEVNGVIMVDGGDNLNAIIKRRGNSNGVDSAPLILGSCSAVIGETPSDTDYGARILIGGGNTSDSWGGYINLIAYGSGGNGSSNSIVFNRRSAANTVSESMRIDKSGNVGIGTSSPSTKLHVNGDIYLPNNQSLWIAGTANSSEKFRFHYNSGNINGPAMIDFRGGALLIRHDVSTVLSVQTSGNVNITGSLSKGSGSFDIKHPNDENKRLVHSFIEGPRCDLIYRGTVQLTNGTATVNLDTDCVEESDCAMTEGTFESLCRNPVKYLHNNDSFSRIKGSISGNILTITCEDPLSSDTIDWMVVAERNDPHIYEWNRTNDNGYLKTEHSS